MPEDQTVTPPEITIETVTAKEPDQLDDNDKTFLEENADTLDDDVAEKYGVVKTPKDIKPEVRGGEAETPADPAKVTPDEDDEDADIDPEDQKRIARLVQKELAKANISGVAKTVQETQIANEVDDFIRTQSAKIPTAGKYREAMLTYMKHPAYAQVPASAVFNIVAGNDLMKMGARLEREASAKVKQTQVNSSSARNDAGTKKDWSSASAEDFAAKKAEILGRPS